jgi:integrase
MATFKICIFKHQQKADKSFPISIRVTWKRQKAYIKTEYYVPRKDVDKNYELKDGFVRDELRARIKRYEELKVVKLGAKIENYTAKELADYFAKHTVEKEDDIIDFIAFSQSHINKLIAKDKQSTAYSIRTTLNAFIDFIKAETFDINELTAKVLLSFEEFLRSERVVTRLNQFGKSVTTKKKGLGNTSIKDYMTNMRTLFNAARTEYNDLDKNEILISHHPFSTYKVSRTPLTTKKAHSIEVIKMIRDLEDIKISGTHGTNRANLSRDIFMLSFYLIGMNAIDIYNLTTIKDGRIEYERAKTKDRRLDSAFISIKIESEAKILIEKYKDPSGERVFLFHNKYSDSQIFSSNIAKGLKQVAQALNIEPFTFYSARHSWATIARNDCHISKDDIHEALNHSDPNMSITDIYIKKDFSNIDVANRKVLDMVK